MDETWLRENSGIVLVLYNQLINELEMMGLSKLLNKPDLGDFANFVYRNSA
ncbi:hypothetical protein A9K97_gp121 [Tokyovirus A1]|uniref:hypothetical protein n=1 Tax=Tokyovirus A1 TaxID=1826170 RepID=UPI0007A990FD|nr:hypothetical protein A9K97_gp121 [Tokyovirus A1]BAU80230.1 hypothetical protein [Tokyovirus A1]